MQHTDLKFFTNEPERTLYDRFSVILKNNTQFFDVLVGYFRSSGFFKLYPAMENIEKIRILVGLNVDKQTVEIIDQSLSPTMAEAREAYEREIEAEFEYCDTTEELELGVAKFIEWLKSGKMEMRMYTKAPIHAKVYIMRKDPEKDPENYGSVITGSSNFSEAGLKNNLEFNVELKDSADVRFALCRFEELWNDGVSITDAYVDAVEKRTWLRNDITPYEIYLKTLYEFFREEINADKDLSAQNLLPPGYMRLQYQIDAVVQARKILEAYNGVFISDVVGLGKTYISAMLAKSLPKGKKLVICPPVLINYWEQVLLEFDVAAKVTSLGKLDSVLSSAERYDYVFVDEAHRFRNAGTDSFSKLHEICYGKKVVLISATPINNYTSDIENQIYLFQPKHTSNIVGVKNLESFFSSLNKKLNGLEKGTPDYLAQIRLNSEEIRDKLLKHIMIRRTRSEIEEYYKEDLEKQGLAFPHLDVPEKIIYSFDDFINRIFDETIYAIKDFTYSRYKPLTYLRDKSEYNTLLIAQHNMGGFMKGILLKRLESSFYAFGMTLSRFIDSYKKFIKMFSRGEVWISKKVNVYDYLDDGDAEELMKQIAEKEGFHFKASDFEPEFIIDLTKDLSKLEHLRDLWNSVTVDPKLETFCYELENNPKLQGNKKIIFTESAETAEYLQRNLCEVYANRVVAYSGKSSLYLKSEIEDSFNPAYVTKENDKYDVLITTDILSEGINLHRSNVIINYDLPWNPTRIMQRVGRINRVGTEFDQIYVFNFFPTAKSSEHMSLEDRILEKLQAFHDTLGEDFKYLSDEEVVSPQKLFDELSFVPSEQEESNNPELKYLAVIRQIRDNDSTLFEKVKRLPKKSRTGKNSGNVTGSATVTFIRKGKLKDFFISGEDTEQISFIEAMKYLECRPDEPRVNVGSAYYGHYQANNTAFDDSLIQQDTIEYGKAQITGNDLTVVKVLKAMLNKPTFTDDQEESIRRLIKAYEDGNIPKNITKNITKDLKTAEDLGAAYYQIFNQVPDTYLYERKNIVLHIDGEKQVVLSCFLKGGAK